MTVRVKLHGRAVKNEVRKGLVNGLAAAGEHLLGVSNERVPLEEGTLMRSGAVIVERSEPLAIVSYDTPYARRQHEELTWRHAEGRSAKYLETALTDEESTLLEIIAARVRREIEQGGTS